MEEASRVVTKEMITDNTDYFLRELKAAYLAMSEQERQVEVALAKEGLWAQPELAVAFPEKAEWPWWE